MEGGYRKYDVVRVDFGDIVLAGEQGGVRPAVIVQNNLGNLHSGTTLVIPFTRTTPVLAVRSLEA